MNGLKAANSNPVVADVKAAVSSSLDAKEMAKQLTAMQTMLTAELASIQKTIKLTWINVREGYKQYWLLNEVDEEIQRLEAIIRSDNCTQENYADYVDSDDDEYDWMVAGKVTRKRPHEPNKRDRLLEGIGQDKHDLLIRKNAIEASLKNIAALNANINNPSDLNKVQHAIQFETALNYLFGNGGERKPEEALTILKTLKALTDDPEVATKAENFFGEAYDIAARYYYNQSIRGSIVVEQINDLIRSHKFSYNFGRSDSFDVREENQRYILKLCEQCEDLERLFEASKLLSTSMDQVRLPNDFSARDVFLKLAIAFLHRDLFVESSVRQTQLMNEMRDKAIYSNDVWFDTSKWKDGWIREERAYHQRQAAAVDAKSLAPGATNNVPVKAIKGVTAPTSNNAAATPVQPTTTTATATSVSSAAAALQRK